MSWNLITQLVVERTAAAISPAPPSGCGSPAPDTEPASRASGKRKIEYHTTALLKE